MAGDVALRNLQAVETQGIADRAIEQARENRFSQEKADDDADESHSLETPPTLNVVVKGDTIGSTEAVTRLLSRLSDLPFPIRIIHTGIGEVTDSDISLAGLTNSSRTTTKDHGIIIAFGTRTNSKTTAVARQSGVKILNSRLIYKLEENLKEIKAKSLRARQEQRNILGTAEVLRDFNDGIVAGCRIKNGAISVGDKVSVLRPPENKHSSKLTTVFEGPVVSIKKFTKTVRKVEKGNECGVSLEGWSDCRPGDILEAVQVIPKKPNAFCL